MMIENEYPEVPEIDVARWRHDKLVGHGLSDIGSGHDIKGEFKIAGGSRHRPEH
jgi:hypothetical protein